MPRRTHVARPELVALLRAVKEQPGADAPRLVLADWLEEYGDEHDRARAAFIRVQCERAALPPADEREADLDRQEEGLRDAHGKAWRGPLGRSIREWEYRRGLAHVRVQGRNFLSRWPAWAGREEFAWIEGVSFLQLTRTSQLREVLRGDLLGNLTTLRLENLRLGPAHVRELARAPRVANLGELDLGDNELGLEGAAFLAGSPHLTRLRSLTLWACTLGPDGVRALGDAPFLGQLDHLSLAYNALGPDGVAILARLRMPRLTRLEVWSNDIQARGVRALLASPLVGGLLDLDLPYSELRDDGARALAESPALGRIRVLSIFANEIRDAGAVALARSPHLANLRRLDLDGNEVGDRGARALAGSPHLGNLRSLNLSSNAIGSAGAAALRARFGDRVQVAPLEE
jgi:uncharacterized protein (TIGR02996 family)